MTRKNPYDARRGSLYTPEIGETIRREGSRPSDELICAEAALVYKKFGREQGAATEVRRALGRAGFNRVDFFNRLGSQALASRNERTSVVIVAFRGTEQDPTDIATDLQAWLKPWDKGAGFMRDSATRSGPSGRKSNLG